MLLMATIIAQVVVLTIKRVFDLMFLQNVVIFSLVPDYTMFGSQHYNQVQQVNEKNVYVFTAVFLKSKFTHTKFISR